MGVQTQTLDRAVGFLNCLGPQRGAPRPLIERLHREIVRACDKPRLREVLLQQAAVAATSTPEEMTRHLEREIGVWREVITRAKVTIQ
jgi:tripartite-type tricarboxylate transporter receptor subunit TctC